MGQWVVRHLMRLPSPDDSLFKCITCRWVNVDERWRSSESDFQLDLLPQWLRHHGFHESRRTTPKISRRQRNTTHFFLFLPYFQVCRLRNPLPSSWSSAILVLQSLPNFVERVIALLLVALTSLDLKPTTDDDTYFNVKESGKTSRRLLFNNVVRTCEHWHLQRYVGISIGQEIHWLGCVYCSENPPDVPERDPWPALQGLHCNRK